MADYRIKVQDCDAEACGYRCQEICQQGVFLAVPRDKDHAKHRADPRYRIVPRFAYFCDGCGQSAILITSRTTGRGLNGVRSLLHKPPDTADDR
jgi:hypothetical protein